MAKKTNSSTDNTSFHGVTFRASVNQIISAFGEPRAMTIRVRIKQTLNGIWRRMKGMYLQFTIGRNIEN
jgi:hypothetical protein